MGYFDKPAKQSQLALFEFFDEEDKLRLGTVAALDGSEHHQQLVSSGYSWRRFGNVNHGWGVWPQHRNYVQQATYHQLKAGESDEAGDTYQACR